MRKNNFLTFCFAFIPGAGHMYLGMMKKGVAIMAAFSAIIAIGGFLQLSFIMFLLPVLWFYSFFDTLNMRHLSYEQLCLKDDRFGFDIGGMLAKDWRGLLNKRHVLLGGTLIFMGVWLVLQNILSPILSQFELWWISDLFYRLPTLLVSFAIIALGVYLVKGKKKEPIPEEDFVAFRGEDHE